MRDEVRGGLRTHLPWRVEASGGGGNFGDNADMSCRPGREDDLAGLLREARAAGVVIEVDKNGKLTQRRNRRQR
jgi:hypothetical protein